MRDWWSPTRENFQSRHRLLCCLFPFARRSSIFTLFCTAREVFIISG